MKEVLIHLIDNPKAVLLIFLFLIFLQLGPGYMAYRIEVALDKLTNRIECGQKINVANKGAVPRENSVN